MAPGATEEQVARVIARVTEVGGQAFVSRGVVRTIIGLVGDLDGFTGLNLPSMDGVQDVHRISDPYKLVSRQHRPERTTVHVGPAGAEVEIGPDTFTFVAGPCFVESAQQTLEAAEMARAAGARLLRGGAFKPRTSPYAFQGLGLKGLELLADVREVTGLPVVTEGVDARDVAVVSEHADMLQVGTRIMTSSALLEAVDECPRPVLLKRGMTAAIEEWLMAAEQVASAATSTSCCASAASAPSSRRPPAPDIAAVPVVQALSHLPIMVDPSHAGGRRDLVMPLSRAAIGVGADEILVDVRPDPENALCDGPQSVNGKDLRDLAPAVRRLAPALGRS